MPSYQYRKPHCGDKTILRPSYLHNGVSYTGKMASLYWIRAQYPKISIRKCPIPPGGVLGLKTDGGVPLAAENWTQKDRGKKFNLGPKRSIFEKIGSFCTPKDSFAVGGWEKVPQKDRARSCQSEKRGSKPRHICITHHIGSTPPHSRSSSVITSGMYWSGLGSESQRVCAIYHFQIFRLFQEL